MNFPVIIMILFPFFVRLLRFAFLKLQLGDSILIRKGTFPCVPVLEQTDMAAC